MLERYLLYIFAVLAPFGSLAVLLIPICLSFEHQSFLGGGETVREPRRMSKSILRPSNGFSSFIEIYSSIVVAILEYYRRVLNVILKKSPIGLFLKHFLT